MADDQQATEYQKELAYLQKNSIMDYNESTSYFKELEKLGLKKFIEPQPVASRPKRGPTIARFPGQAQSELENIAEQYQDFVMGQRSKS